MLDAAYVLKSMPSVDKLLVNMHVHVSDIELSEEGYQERLQRATKTLIISASPQPRAVTVEFFASTGAMDGGIKLRAHVQAYHLVLHFMSCLKRLGVVDKESALHRRETDICLGADAYDWKQEAHPFRMMV